MSFEYYYKWAICWEVSEVLIAMLALHRKFAAIIYWGKNGCCIFILLQKLAHKLYILQTTAGKLSLYSISVEFPQSIKP
jgi:hypothetical protein